jgi:hypothetical protein
MQKENFVDMSCTGIHAAVKNKYCECLITVELKMCVEIETIKHDGKKCSFKKETVRPGYNGLKENMVLWALVIKSANGPSIQPAIFYYKCRTYSVEMLIK